MSESPEALQRRIAELEAQLRALHARTGDQIAGDKIGQDKVGGDKVGGDKHTGAVDNQGRIDGVAVGINLGAIVYGRAPAEDERRRLVWYLNRLANKLYQLPLRGLEERLDQGQGIALPQVYVEVATTEQRELYSGLLEHLAHWFEDNNPSKSSHRGCHPDYVLPEKAVINTSWWPADPETFPDTQWHTLFRSLLATEAVYEHDRLVLLGDPGSGKSTFVHHLAWALAQHGLEQPAPALHGWDDTPPVLPIIVPLRALAGRLAAAGNPDTAVYAALRDELLSCNLTQVDDMLHEALHRGVALLLFDGLDEVPLAAVPGVTDNRATTLQTVRDFARGYPQTHVVVTCRTRAFDQSLRDRLAWPVETIAPFTLGQVRHFVPAWYRELAAKGQIAHEQVVRLAQTLIDSIVTSPKLRAMAQTPLLLTLMALVRYNKGELPRDRPQLYERILELLLGQWDKVRDGQSLAEAIGLPDWGSERIQPLLDRLSYEAHADAASDDGRGRIVRGTLYTELIDFFRTARVVEPGNVALRWVDYIEHRSGLLMPDGTKTYVFAHLTLQEHCAGRHITLGVDNPLALVLRHRTDDRWREPILLGMGLTRPSDLHSILADLIDREENDQLKPIERWYRDLILAAEIGADRDWDYLRTRPMVKVDRLQRDLRRGLVELLGDKAQPLPVAERVRAGFLLGDIGDPRFPVTLDAWREEVARRNELFGQPESYWCYVRPGTYCIGGWQKNEVITDLALPGFWIARFPITVAQFAPFVQAGYALDVHRWWTLHGRRWKRQRIRTQPWLWDDSAYTCPNQPVIGVTWYEAMAFCAWLNDQLAGALSPGHVVRLPTEAEWETAAAYDSVGNRHPYPWGALASTPELVISVESKLGRPAPIGSCPAGVAACGALDMVGNMWEWVASRYRAYPADSGRHVDDFTMDDRNVPLRGGSYDSNSISVRCGLRGWNSPDEYDPYNGFRIVIAPHLH